MADRISHILFILNCCYCILGETVKTFGSNRFRSEVVSSGRGPKNTGGRHRRPLALIGTIVVTAALLCAGDAAADKFGGGPCESPIRRSGKRYRPHSEVPFLPDQYPGSTVTDGPGLYVIVRKDSAVTITSVSKNCTIIQNIYISLTTEKRRTELDITIPETR